MRGPVVFSVPLTLMSPSLCAHAGSASAAFAPTAGTAPWMLWSTALTGVLVGILIVLARRRLFARAALAGAVFSVSVACFAPVVPVPNTFENGQLADASEVNANFDEVVTQIANHADDTSLHPTSVDGLGGGTVEGDVKIAGSLNADALTVQSVQLSNGTVAGTLTVLVDGSISLQVAGGGAGIVFAPNGDVTLSGRIVDVDGVAIGLRSDTTLDAETVGALSLNGGVINLN